MKISRAEWLRLRARAAKRRPTPLVVARPGLIAVGPEWLTLRLGLRVTNPLNGSQKAIYAAARKRKKARDTAKIIVGAYVRQHELEPPYVVEVVRIAPRKLDRHDGLGASLKGVIDGIADAFGMRDDDARVTFTTDQRRGGVGEYNVEVTIHGVKR